MNQSLLNALDAVQIDPKSPANVTYAKARYAIEDAAKSRAERREAKHAVVALLKGVVNSTPLPAKRIGGRLVPVVKREVKFADGSTARY